MDKIVIGSANVFVGPTKMSGYGSAYFPQKNDILYIDDLLKKSEEKVGQFWDIDIPKHRNYAFLRNTSYLRAAYMHTHPDAADSYLIDLIYIEEKIAVHEAAHRLQHVQLEKNNLFGYVEEMKNSPTTKSLLTDACARMSAEIFAYYTQKALGYEFDAHNTANLDILMPEEQTQLNVLIEAMRFTVNTCGWEAWDDSLHLASKCIADILYTVGYPAEALRLHLIDTDKTNFTDIYVNFCREIRAGMP